jgi:UDP-3-O-[3-hydroxymyristoyl] glucosamine N-acyltransferase
MDFPFAYTLAEFAKKFNLDFDGNGDLPLSGSNEIHRVRQGDIIFCDAAKYYNKAFQSAASVVIVKEKIDFPEGKGILISPDPFATFNLINEHFSPVQVAESFSRPEYPNTDIAPNVMIGKNVKIGEGTTLHPGVVVYDNTVIGKNVTIHANTVLGADAFYYQKRADGYNQMHSCGNVVIEDHVDIGALCTIDKGVSADTRIGKGSKIDNQVHIGHDTVLGEHCLIAGKNAIAGCVKIGNNVKIWGNCSISSDVHLADGTEILAFSGVNKNTVENSRMFGIPAIDAREKMRELAAIKGLTKRK